jgi:hypothetical protein
MFYSDIYESRGLYKVGLILKTEMDNLKYMSWKAV